MKRIIFTLMMIAGLAMVANTAMADNEKTVYAGSTYDYSLTGIKTANDATVTSVTYSTGNVNITDAGSTYDISAGNDQTVSFSAEYTATAISGYFEITIQDDVSLCSNKIQYHIVVMDPPVYTLTIAAVPTETCQNGTGAADNEADIRGGESNTITYTITPVVENVITGLNYTYEFAFALPANTLIITDLAQANVGAGGTVTTYPNGTVSVTQVGEGNGSQTLTAFTIDVTDTNNASLTILDGSDNDNGTVIAGEIAATGSDTATTNVKAVPSMGSF